MTTALPQNLGARNLAMLARLVGDVTPLSAFLVAGGAFSLQLSGLDPRAPVGADSASSQSQIALGLAYAALIWRGLRTPQRMGALLRANWLLLALPALALLSCLWAPEPLVALRRGGALAATITAGIAVATALPGAATLRFLVRAAAAATLASLVYVLIAPTYAVHQISDGAQSVHAGAWRGLFVHRTALGQLAALTLALAVHQGEAFRGVVVRGAVIASAGLCLMMARSGGGLVSAALLLATPALLWAGRRLGWRGWWALAGVVLAGAAAWRLAPWLLSLLGKDATLTGRVPLWSLMLRLAAQRPLLGYGYSTGFRDVVAPQVAAWSPFGYVPNAQNGYLDVVLNLGLAGLALALAILGMAFRRALRLAADADAPFALAPLLIVVFIAELNGIEAALISANDLFVLIYAATVAAAGEMTARSR